MTILEMGHKAKEASRILAQAKTVQKNKALIKMAENICKYEKDILHANNLDVEYAKGNGMSDSLVDRLKVNASRIEGMVNGLRKVAALADPIGEILSMWKVENGLQIGQQRVPIGVIGIIYEARPNVTCDGAGLCLKSGNAVILKGGKEAFRTNEAIVNVLRQTLSECGLPEDCIQFIKDTKRETTLEMMKCNKYIDVIIPRGGAGLIKAVVENATVPVIETGTGNCHIFIDGECDNEMALNIAVNAKTSRVSVCNSAEKILIHKNKVEEILPLLITALKNHGVVIRGDETVKLYDTEMSVATEEDWYEEYLDYIVGIKVVGSIEEAIHHINTYSSHHSDAIVTTNYGHSEQFLHGIDSAVVYVNASTRFTDGEEFGFGAEIGISTQKLHARGPMGLKELTTIKYIVRGDGQIR